MKKYFASSELIINEDGSVFHLHVKENRNSFIFLFIRSTNSTYILIRVATRLETRVRRLVIRYILPSYRQPVLTVIHPCGTSVHSRYGSRINT